MGELESLLVLLRVLYDEFTPSELVLWEIIGGEDEDFDGTLLMEEVFRGTSVLVAHAMTYEESVSNNSGNDEVFVELKHLRDECQHQSIEGVLFANKTKQSVGFAEVLKWWWDMPEEYRAAAGLSLPAEKVKTSHQRQPEEMFKTALRQVGANPAAAEFSLRGHAQLFAELQALGARRICECLKSGAGTSSGTSSEVCSNSTKTASRRRRPDSSLGDPGDCEELDGEDEPPVRALLRNRAGKSTSNNSDDERDSVDGDEGHGYTPGTNGKSNVSRAENDRRSGGYPASSSSTSQ